MLNWDRESDALRLLTTRPPPQGSRSKAGTALTSLESRESHCAEVSLQESPKNNAQKMIKVIMSFQSKVQGLLVFILIFWPLNKERARSGARSWRHNLGENDVIRPFPSMRESTHKGFLTKKGIFYIFEWWACKGLFSIWKHFMMSICFHLIFDMKTWSVHHFELEVVFILELGELYT